MALETTTTENSTSTYATPSYANPELRDFQILSICLLFEEKNGEIGNVIEEFARQVSLEVDNDDVQELLDSHNQELIIGEFIEMQA
ncbi:hypothetical protein TNCV_1582411 [Trichonephila clavipes]|nr:hypothetical protein TNCV_1582411 [Trichonephila clavipes]